MTASVVRSPTAFGCSCIRSVCLNSRTFRLQDRQRRITYDGTAAGVAQWSEQRICNPWAVGSNPTSGSPCRSWRSSTHCRRARRRSTRSLCSCLATRGRPTTSRPVARRPRAFRSPSTPRASSSHSAAGPSSSSARRIATTADLTQIDELHALCLAAVRGDFRETVWFKGDEVIGSRGWAKIGSDEVGHRWGRSSRTRSGGRESAFTRTTLRVATPPPTPRQTGPPFCP
jgi:hypothetical protein